MMRIVSATTMMVWPMSPDQKLTMGPRLRLPAAHVNVRTLRHGLGRPADRISHVEIRNRQRERGGVDGAGHAELTPGRRLDRVETLEPRTHLEEAAAQLA